MILDTDFLAYCFKQLTSHQLSVYLACRMIGPTETYLSQIAELCDFSSVATVHHHMKALHKKGFILYSAKPHIGTKIYWIRTSKIQRVPTFREVDAA